MSIFTAPSRFAGLSLYAVLGVDTSAGTDGIKRGYRRAALKYHPDHNHSPDANDEFAYLAHAHDILSNAATRALYDEAGIHDSSSSSAASAFDSDSATASVDYWRSVFPQVTAEDIEAFRLKYVGSDEEVEDVKAAYARYEGDVQHVLDSIPFCEADSVPRLCELLNRHCQARISAQQQKRLQKKAERWQRREQAEFEQLALDGSAAEKEAAKAAGDMKQLVALLARRKEEQKEKQDQWLAYMGDKYGGAAKPKRLTKGKTAGKGKAGKGTTEEKEAEQEEDEEKEGGDEPSEKEFQRIQAAMMKRREANRATDTATNRTTGKQGKSSAERDKKRRKTNK